MAFPARITPLPAKGIPAKLRKILQDIMDFCEERQPLPQGAGYAETPSGITFPCGGVGGAGIRPLGPFDVYTVSGDPGTVNINEKSTILQSPTLDDTIDISGLGDPFQLDIENNPRQRIWIECTLPVEDGDDITGAVGYGVDWNAGKDFFPEPIKWDTDNGSAKGTGTPPANRKPLSLFIPIAETFPSTDTKFPGLTSLSDKVVMRQLATTNFLIYAMCYKGANVPLALPWTGGFDE